MSMARNNAERESPATSAIRNPSRWYGSATLSQLIMNHWERAQAHQVWQPQPLRAEARHEERRRVSAGAEEPRGPRLAADARGGDDEQQIEQQHTDADPP